MATQAQIVDVLSASYTAAPGFIDLVVVVEGYPGESGPIQVPYTWNVNEEYDNSWNVAAWFASHPDFEIGPYVPAPVVAAMVKTESARRIELVIPRWMFEREFTGGEPIPQTAKDAVALIRLRSNEIEAMNPIPQDYTNDSYWQ